MKNKTRSFFSILLLPFTFLICTSFMPDNFKTQQQKFPRVKTAYTDKETTLKELFSSKGIALSSARIFIRAFKKEKELEVWANSSAKGKYTLIKTYEICASSGGLGPKRKQSDGQVPEGFYEIDRFNPSSNFYLSLGVSYPNASDRILGEKGNLGGDIFIHGNCVTIGCMPLTDDKIKEVYLMAVEAKASGQEKIPVHIFPCRMNEMNMNVIENEFKDDHKQISFWKNIQKGFEAFETNKELPEISVGKSGEYLFK